MIPLARIVLLAAFVFGGMVGALCANAAIVYAEAGR